MLFHVSDCCRLNLEEVHIRVWVEKPVLVMVTPACGAILYLHSVSCVVMDIITDLALPCLDTCGSSVVVHQAICRIRYPQELILVDLSEIIEFMELLLNEADPKYEYLVLRFF